MQAQAKCASKVWREPDQGIWEARGAPRHYVSSKLMCWVAMDRAAQARGDARRRKLERAWGATAGEIKCGHPRPRTSASTASCASTTRPTRSTHRTCWPRIFGFFADDDERLRASVMAIAEDLTEDGFVLRYRTDETDDGMSGKEGSFLICSFWLVSALAIIGQFQRARDLMEKLLSVGIAAGPIRGGVRHQHGASPGQLPAGLLAPRADRGRRPDHPRRAPRGDRGCATLRHHHDRQRRERRHARAPPGAAREENLSLRHRPRGVRARHQVARARAREPLRRRHELVPPSAPSTRRRRRSRTDCASAAICSSVPVQQWRLRDASSQQASRRHRRRRFRRARGRAQASPRGRGRDRRGPHEPPSIPATALPGSRRTGSLPASAPIRSAWRSGAPRTRAC